MYNKKQLITAKDGQERLVENLIFKIMGLLEAFPTPKRTMVFIIIVGTPDSMAGSKIGAVNQAIREFSPLFDNILSSYDADAETKIAILQYSTGCKWISSEPKLCSEFTFLDMEASGKNDLGAAFLEINNKLSRDGFRPTIFRSLAPVLLLMSDCNPTDDWEAGISKLNYSGLKIQRFE